jgi:hypothetical protein
MRGLQSSVTLCGTIGGPSRSSKQRKFQAIQRTKEKKPAALRIIKRSNDFTQSGKVEEKAREAEKALDGPEKDALQKAEEVGGWSGTAG